MIDLFLEGGAMWMSILTVGLIALLLAAWKAPGWVKEIGLIALVSGPLAFMLGLSQAGKAIMAAGDISPSLVVGGFRASLIPVIYGILIYVASLVIRIIQKPRFL